MDQYNENNVNGHRTRPEFKKELVFYVPGNAAEVILPKEYAGKRVRVEEIK